MKLSTPLHVDSDFAPQALFTLRARDRVSLVGLFLIGIHIAVAGTATPGNSDFSVAVAGGLLAVALFIPPVLAFVAGQLALVATLPGEITAVIAAAQLGSLLVLFEPARGADVRGTSIVAAISTAVLGAIVFALSQQGIVRAGVGLCLAVGGSVYVFRRVTLVRLGAVEPTQTQTETQTDTTRNE